MLKHHFWRRADSDEGLEAANGRLVLPAHKRCIGRMGPEPGSCPLGRSSVWSLVLLRGATLSLMRLRGSRGPRISIPLLECQGFAVRFQECAGQPWALHACYCSHLWVFSWPLFHQAWAWCTELLALVVEQPAPPSHRRISYIRFLEQMRFAGVFKVIWSLRIAKTAIACCALPFLFLSVYINIWRAFNSYFITKYFY